MGDPPTDHPDTDADAFRSQALADVAAETDRMARMVRQLLILARADAGATLDPRPTPLDEVLAAACRQAHWMGDGFSLVTPAPGALAGPVVNGDADYLTQAVVILLDNAVKYTPPPGEIRLEADHDGHLTRITVADTGLGVPPEEADRIFERFYRGRNAVAATGTGLGLAIARWVVEQHGGHIELDSSPNGSRFSILLPLAEPRGVSHEHHVAQVATDALEWGLVSEAELVERRRPADHVRRAGPPR